jgi:ubiquinone/menaquinone biosynthesis C-methylase UbiE
MAQQIEKTYIEPSLLFGKHILDCCCGSRMFWFDKNNPFVLFADIRELKTELCDGSLLEVKPDIVADFRNMPFEDNTFKMVVFDPPHLHKLSENTWMAQKYGVLFSTWEQDIKEGFNESMRVLQPFGTLIFKWNEAQITTSKILKVIGVEPLFGHPSGKHGRTKWMAFMKGVTH